MTTGVLPPLRELRSIARQSRCLLHFRACDIENAAVGGQLATFTRGATTLIADEALNTFLIGYTQPTWENLTWMGASSQSMFLRLGTLDRFHFAADWVPQDLWFYHEFRQSGSMAANNTALWSVCNDGATGARLVLDSTGTYYRLRHHNGSTEQTVTLASAPAAGDSVVLYGRLKSTGAVQLFQNVNNVAVSNTAESSANTLASAWASGSRVRMSALGTTAGAAQFLRTFKLVAGNPTLSQLERAF